MAIVQTDPPGPLTVNAIQVDSDAANNMAAIHEIDEWAVANGFERINQAWLRQRRLPDGRRVFRGVCIRLTPDEFSARQEENQQAIDRMANMPIESHTLRPSPEGV